MGAALALLVLLAGSVFIVRIASVFLRLTGLPDNVARFQSVSALTGAGFTTSESESIVNYPARRRVIVGLMVLGNLGLVSVASTFIVALAASSDSQTEILRQIGLLLAVSALIAIFMVNKTFDRLICGIIERLMRRFLKRELDAFETMLRLPSGAVVARHSNSTGKAVQLTYDRLQELSLVLIDAESSVGELGGTLGNSVSIGPRRSIICAGKPDAHLALSRVLTTGNPAQ